jgi:hypothetical protein
MAQPAETTPPELVEAIRVNEPSAERESKVEVEGSKEKLAEELLKKSRPAKAPTRPTVPMRSKSRRGDCARATLRRARKTMRHQGGLRGYVVIVDSCSLTYGGGREEKREKGMKGEEKSRGGEVRGQL